MTEAIVPMAIMTNVHPLLHVLVMTEVLAQTVVIASVCRRVTAVATDLLAPAPMTAVLVQMAPIRAVVQYLVVQFKETQIMILPRRLMTVRVQEQEATPEAATIQEINYDFRTNR
jgi:hypothetical protein